MSYLAANLSALGAANGSAFALPDDDGRVRVDASGEFPVIELVADDGSSLALNSRRNPVAEARRTVEAALAGKPEPRAVVAVGLGLGYIVEAVAERCPGAKILALEPEPGCVRPLLERRDWTPLISSGRLLLLFGPEYRGAGEGWRWIAGSDDARVTIANPVLARQRPERIGAAAKIVERMVYGARANDEARKRFAGRYLLNTLKNVRAIARSGDAGALFGAFAGVPGIIISAGPSLDRNLRELRAVANRAVLIAVDTALRPLLTSEVHPHLVVALDPSEANGRHLRDLPDTGRVHLVAEGSVDPRAFCEFDDRIFTFKVSDHQPWPWLLAQGLERSTLRAWGSVATSAFDLALKMGCDPIVFVGQDLGYTDGRPYCRDVTFEDEWARAVACDLSLSDVWTLNLARRTLCLEPDVRGVDTPVSNELAAFRDWLLEQFRSNPDRSYVNATGAGFLVGSGVRQVRDGELCRIVSAPVAASERVAERHAASRHHVDGKRLADRLEEAWQGEPGELWMRFAGDTVSPDQLAAAVQDSRGRLLAPEPCRPGTARREAARRGRPAWRAPERVAIVRAIRRGSAFPSWVAVPPDEATRPPGRFVRAAYRRLLKILEQSDLLDGAQYLAPPVAQGRWPIGLVPSVAFPWTAPVGEDVRRFEEIVATCAVALRPAGELDPPPDRAQAPGVAVSTEAVEAGRTMQLDGEARCALAAVFVDLLRYGTGSARLDELARLMRDACRPEAAAGASVRQAQVSLARPGRARARGRSEVTWRQDPASLADSIRGVLVGADASRFEDRDRSRRQAAEDGFSLRVELPPVPLPGGGGAAVMHPFSRTITRIVPLALGEAGLGPGAIVTSLDSGHALVTRLHTDETCRVAEDGSWSTWQRWPAIVIGAVPWGSEGGRLAWHNGTDRWPLTPPYLLWQGAEGHPIARLELPFRPNSGIRHEAGQMVWASHEGGIGVWSPADGSRLVHEDLSLIGVTADGSDVRLDPLVADERRPGWPTAAWRWTQGSAPVPMPVGAMGSRTAVAASGAWTATAHPYAGIVHLRGPEGRQVHLHCFHAFTLAWAGSSLVVGTLDSDVFVFRHLRSHLQDDQFGVAGGAFRGERS